MPDFKKKMNTFRRKVMRGLTNHIGKTKQTVKPISLNEIKSILIVRPNHRLGNMLMVTPLVNEVSSQFPNCEITLFVKGDAAKIIFPNYAAVRKIIHLPRAVFKKFFSYLYGWIKLVTKSYDLVINVMPLSSSGRIATKLARSEYKFFGDEALQSYSDFQDAKQLGRYPVLAFREYLKKAGLTVKANPIPLMNLKLTGSELKKGERLLCEMIGNTKKTICIFTYATGTKCYAKSFWIPFYEALQNRYPEYNIIEVLPVENVSQIDFKAPSFYSKNIREIGAFIAQAEVFIGADSGMMHLASSALTSTLGLFSVTDIKSFKPYGNKSTAISITDNNCEKCFSAIDSMLHKTKAPLLA